jgi:hypothetical protein
MTTCLPPTKRPVAAKIIAKKSDTFYNHYFFFTESPFHIHNSTGIATTRFLIIVASHFSFKLILP